jgi:hypothetical protein
VYKDEAVFSLMGEEGEADSNSQSTPEEPDSTDQAGGSETDDPDGVDPPRETLGDWGSRPFELKKSDDSSNEEERQAGIVSKPTPEEPDSMDQAGSSETDNQGAIEPPSATVEVLDGASETGAETNAEAELREEIAMLQDELSDWPDGETREITYQELVQQPDGSYKLVTKTQIMTKEEAESLLDSMEDQLKT